MAPSQLQCFKHMSVVWFRHTYLSRMTLTVLNPLWRASWMTCCNRQQQCCALGGAGRGRRVTRAGLLVQRVPAATRVCRVA